MSWLTDTSGTDAYLGSMSTLELDGCGCLTGEEHMSKCVLWTPPGLVLARPMETMDRRAKARATMTRWRAANPERWREIQRASDVRRGRRAA